MDDLTLIDDLTMHALIAKDERGLTTDGICKALKNTGTPSTAAITAALGRLCERALIEEMPRKPRQRIVRFRLLNAGREHLRRLLPESAMTVRARRKAARLLAMQHTFGVEPALAPAIMDKKEGLVTYLLAKRLGLEFHAGTKAADLARRVAGAELGVPDSKADTLWSALVTRGMPKTATATTAEMPRERANFAEEVKQAAPRAMNGWLGPRKLFIHRAWEAWRTEAADPLDLPAFKSHLVQASRTGALSLARADFTIGLDPADLASSETRDGAEIFHFLSIAQEARQ